MDGWMTNRRTRLIQTDVIYLFVCFLLGMDISVDGRDIFKTSMEGSYGDGFVLEMKDGIWDGWMGGLH